MSLLGRIPFLQKLLLTGAVTGLGVTGLSNVKQNAAEKAMATEMAALPDQEMAQRIATNEAKISQAATSAGMGAGLLSMAAVTLLLGCGDDKSNKPVAPRNTGSPKQR